MTKNETEDFMPKQSMMIRVNSKALRESIIKRQSLASLETLLGVSRQVINGWLIKNRIPPRKLSILAGELDFSVDEVEAITASPKDSEVLPSRTVTVFVNSDV